MEVLVRFWYNDDVQFENNKFYGNIRVSGQEYRWIDKFSYQRLKRQEKLEIIVGCKGYLGCGEEEEISTRLYMKRIKDKEQVESISKLGLEELNTTRIQFLDEFPEDPSEHLPYVVVSSCSEVTKVPKVPKISPEVPEIVRKIMG